jgi:hypothetical protein
MNISVVTNLVKIGQFTLCKTPGSKNLIDFYYSNKNDPVLKSKEGRVYFFTEDDRIVKIGGSADKNGMLGTLRFYLTSMSGSPSSNRYVIHRLIYSRIMAGKRIECFMIKAPPTSAMVRGLFDEISMPVNPYLEMEARCKEDFFRDTEKYPDWNFQENSEPLPDDLALKHAEYQGARISNKSRK